MKKAQKRYGALTLLAKLQLLAVFFCIQVVVWLLFHALSLRFVAAVLTAAVLMVMVKTRKPTPR